MALGKLHVSLKARNVQFTRKRGNRPGREGISSSCSKTPSKPISTRPEFRNFRSVTRRSVKTCTLYSQLRRIIAPSIPKIRVNIKELETHRVKQYQLLTTQPNIVTPAAGPRTPYISAHLFGSLLLGGISPTLTSNSGHSRKKK